MFKTNPPPQWRQASLEVPQWLTDWVRGYRTGMSSETIAYTLAGAPGLVPRPKTPSDTSDFYRCHTLLDLAAENGQDWRARLQEVADVFPDWQPLVEKWADLERALAEDVSAQRELDRQAWISPKTGRKLKKKRAVCYPPSRCWWLLAVLQDRYDPYGNIQPHPFGDEKEALEQEKAGEDT